MLIQTVNQNLSSDEYVTYPEIEDFVVRYGEIYNANDIK